MKKVIRFLVQNRLTWPIFKGFFKIANRFQFEKELIEIEKRNAKTQMLELKMQDRFADLVVRNGIFKGMKYPRFLAHGSSLFPKLLGSYESELNNTIENLLKKDYAYIFDIGCAEGYYAIGIAMRTKHSKVIAFDVNEAALNSCKEMAKINQVEGQLEFGKFCDAKTLAEFNFVGKSLIISDCEGYELDLFTKESVANLKNCDVLIELHDLYNEKISFQIEEVFQNTHLIQKVYSESTFKKLKHFPETSNWTDEEINTFMLERNGIMAWAIITPK